MFLSLLASAFISAPASAQAIYATPQEQKVSVSVWEHTGAGNRTYYNCDSLETLTKTMLQQLGAIDINVRCSGGLDGFGDYWGSPLITARFTSALRSADQSGALAAYQYVVLKDSDNCHAAQTIFKALSKKMDLAETKGTKSFCDSSDSYKIETMALSFQL